MSSERPAKRVRQACEPCRRKKSRCPGEKPVCSHCSRLRQNCYYAEDRHEAERSFSPVPLPGRIATGGGGEGGNGVTGIGTGGVLEDRLKYVEAQLAEVLAHQSRSNRSSENEVPESPAPVRNSNVHPMRQPLNSRPSETGELPPWDEIVRVAEIYLLYCDCQPLPIFHRPSFMQTLRQRQHEVLFAILALTLRFQEADNPSRTKTEFIAGYLEAARTICYKKMFDGDVDLATIQTLIILTLVDFTDGHTRRASIFTSMAMSLAQNAGLTSETQMRLSERDKEERRRCFWSLFLLKRLHGADFIILDFAAEDNFPWYPETTGSPPNPSSATTQIMGAYSDPEGLSDKGIVAYAIQLSEVFFKITRYAWRRGKPSAVPPWSATSEFTTILASQMDFETRMPFMYRFEPARFSQQSLEHLNSNRDYWGPWLFIQFLYHTNLCLLTHPLLMSLRLRNNKCVIPEIFLQHTSDLVSSHASWIVNLMDMLEAKSFKVSDPFLGHCVAIVATIYLQESFVEDEEKRRRKQESFVKCLKFIRDFGPQWPHLSRIASKLQRLAETVSSTYVVSEAPTRQNRKLLIDLGQFFEVLEYSSSSELPGSKGKMFGLGLQGDNVEQSRRDREIAQTSVLPEPTRVEGQEFGSTPLGTPVGSTGFGGPLGCQGDMGLGVGSGGAGMGSVGTGTEGGMNTPFTAMMNYSEDELAVLAESFFHQNQGLGQQQQDGGVNSGGGGGGNGSWWNMRYL